MPSHKFSLDDLYTFIKSVEIGSFTSTAKFFSINVTTVARKISNLESYLGVNLIERTNNSFHPTPIGNKIIEQINVANLNLDYVQQVVNNIVYGDSIPGKIFFSLPPGIGINHVSRHIHKFIIANPNVDLNISYQGNCPDLVKDNIDIALVFQPPTKHVNQKVKKIGVLGFKLYCTLSYKEKYGIPNKPSDLVHHRFVGVLNNDLTVRKTVEFTNKLTGEIYSVEVPNKITTNSLINNLELVRSNEMIAAIWDNTEHSIDDNFIQVLDEFEPDNICIYLLKHPYRHDSNIDLLGKFVEEIFHKN